MGGLEQGARVQSQLLVEQKTAFLEYRECLDLPSASVQHPHEYGAKRLAKGELPYQFGQLSHRGSRVTPAEVKLRKMFHDCEPLVVENSGRVDQLPAGQADQGRPTPLPQCMSQELDGLVDCPFGNELLGLMDASLKPKRVNREARNSKSVADGAVHYLDPTACRLERSAKTAHHVVYLLAGGARRFIPQNINDAFERNGLVAVHREERQ